MTCYGARRYPPDLHGEGPSTHGSELLPMNGRLRSFFSMVLQSPTSAEVCVLEEIERRRSEAGRDASHPTSGTAEVTWKK